MDMLQVGALPLSAGLWRKGKPPSHFLGGGGGGGAQGSRFLVFLAFLAAYVAGILTGGVLFSPPGTGGLSSSMASLVSLTGNFGGLTSRWYSDHPREEADEDGEAAADGEGDSSANGSDSESAPSSAHRSSAKRLALALSKRGTVSCKNLATFRAKFVHYLTSGRPAVMNMIGQMDAEVLLPAIADLMPHDNGVFMIDIGANLGQTSGAMMSFICGGNCTPNSACMGNPGTGVIAFEPQKQVFADLNALARAQKWGLCGWTSVNAAVSSARGKLTLFGGSTHASLDKTAAWMDHKKHGSHKAEEVEVTTVDDLVTERKLKSIFLLKVDTEGFDPAVIQGATNTLKAQIPRFVLAEYNTKWFEANNHSSLEKFVARMWRHGYLCYVFTPNNFVPLSGNWWAPELEFKRWSNIFCGVAGDPALELLLRRVNWIYAPPIAKCTGAFPRDTGSTPESAPKSGDVEGDRPLDWDPVAEKKRAPKRIPLPQRMR